MTLLLRRVPIGLLGYAAVVLNGYIKLANIMHLSDMEDISDVFAIINDRRSSCKMAMRWKSQDSTNADNFKNGVLEPYRMHMQLLKVYVLFFFCIPEPYSRICLKMQIFALKGTP